MTMHLLSRQTASKFIVMALVLAAAAGGSYKVRKTLIKATESAAWSSILAINTGLAMYTSEHPVDLPPGDWLLIGGDAYDSLMKEVVRGNGSDSRVGPDGIPVDRWKNRFIIRIKTSEDGTVGLDCICMGVDGIFGAIDDIDAKGPASYGRP